MQFSLKLLAIAFAVFPSALADKTFVININNECPSDVPLFINAGFDSIIPRGAGVTKTFPGNFSGLIYSTANGGLGTGRLVTSAGFHLEDDYYYILKDQTHFNMGVTVSPQAAAANGFCPELSCETADCTGVFPLSQQPLSFPPPGNSPPAPPLAECPGANSGFTVTFCPTQAFPPDADV
ncbi:hypothetical protein CCMSSC00406_0009303 [Pleurotus cornucopiae]|uniref:Uncharacterized protein n=1 Tax=Pleurotus cornucopiae TaxID=5321 RepID=A0ACB7IW62_PLECO|nr:hypothetical protein CCMSSC00406_0009303 [Pleurotus cornucopiae]